MLSFRNREISVTSYKGVFDIDKLCVKPAISRFGQHRIMLGKENPIGCWGG